ncbi:MAG: hypothetical protein NZ890_03105 [Myxococcota bacterium]|nr:hypothetical protein [Myxococcota bacterium]
MTIYPPQATLKEARQQYVIDNGFGEDGGYTAKWVALKAGPISLIIPNTAARVRAVRVHDLHHVVTGYQTDWKGECEIGAWEIASGCQSYGAAWLLNLLAMSHGVLIFPRATLAAWVRGRHSKNLYGVPCGEELLAQTVEQTRRELGLDQAAPRATALDVITLVLWGGGGGLRSGLALAAAPSCRAAPVGGACASVMC